MLLNHNNLRKEILKHTLIVLSTMDESKQTAWDINNGLCEDFALDIISKFGGESDTLFGVWLDEYGVNHFVICFNEKYYDAECPDGVDRITDIPCYKNRNRTREEVLKKPKII